MLTASRRQRLHGFRVKVVYYALLCTGVEMASPTRWSLLRGVVRSRFVMLVSENGSDGHDGSPAVVNDYLILSKDMKSVTGVGGNSSDCWKYQHGNGDLLYLLAY
jgi:hypothetical protein